MNTGTHVALDGNLTIADAAETWIRRVEANGMRGEGAAERATIRQYRQHVNLHIVPHIGKLKLAKLTKKDIENFRDRPSGGLASEVSSRASAQGADEPQVAT